MWCRACFGFGRSFCRFVRSFDDWLERLIGHHFRPLDNASAGRPSAVDDTTDGTMEDTSARRPIGLITHDLPGAFNRCDSRGVPSPLLSECIGWCSSTSTHVKNRCRMPLWIYTQRCRSAFIRADQSAFYLLLYQPPRVLFVRVKARACNDGSALCDNHLSTRTMDVRSCRFNTGVWLLRRCPRAFALLDLWWEAALRPEYTQRIVSGTYLEPMGAAAVLQSWPVLLARCLLLSPTDRQSGAVCPFEVLLCHESSFWSLLVNGQI